MRVNLTTGACTSVKPRSRNAGKRALRAKDNVSKEDDWMFAEYTERTYT